MKTLLVLYSFHHKNTEKVAKAFARVLDAQIRTPQQVNPEELQEYGLLGFGSGIYSDKHHRSLFDLVDKLPRVDDRKAFIFSTSGAPAFALDGGHLEEYAESAHLPLRERLQSKGYAIVDEFNEGVAAGLFILAIHFQQQFGALAGGQHHDAHDAFGIDPVTFFIEEYRAAEL